MAPRFVQQVCLSSPDALAFVGLQGVVIIDTSNYAIRVQDGVTPGGHLTLMADANLSDLTDKEQARKALDLGSAALLNADAGFMLGANNLSEIVDPATGRVNIQAAQSGNNTDIHSIVLNTAGLKIRAPNEEAIITVDFSPAEGAPFTDSIVINLVLPNVDATIHLSGSNTGDQNIVFSGDAAGAGTTAIEVTINARAVTGAKMALATILSENIAEGGVKGANLETIDGVAGTYSLASVQIDQYGRVIAAGAGTFDGLITHKAVSPPQACAHGATWGHGLGVVPDLVYCTWINTVAEHGFVPGDMVMMTNDVGGHDDNNGVTYKITNASITMFMNLLPILISPDGTANNTNPANWTVQFTAISFA